jgi:hypothetical protein
MTPLPSWNHQLLLRRISGGFAHSAAGQSTPVGIPLEETTSAIGVKLRMCVTMAEMRAPGSSDEASTFQVTRVSPDSLHVELESGLRSAVRGRETVAPSGVHFCEVASNSCQD